MRDLGREDDVERLNRQALRIAREVADATGTLMAGNIAHTWAYDANNPGAIQETRDIFKVSMQKLKNKLITTSLKIKSGIVHQ